MAEGWRLTEGKYVERELTHDEVWAIFNHAFSNLTKNTTSYKFVFFKALIDNLYNVDSTLSLTFDSIFRKFAEICWNIVLKYNLRQIVGKSSSALEKVLFQEREKWCGSSSFIVFENLPILAQDEIVGSIKKKCKRFVVGAFWEDTSECIYSFSLRDEWIQFNPQLYDFICLHKLTLEKLNYYEFAKFLERVNNPDVTKSLLTKIDSSTKRSNLAFFKRILSEEFSEKTGKSAGCRSYIQTVHGGYAFSVP